MGNELKIVLTVLAIYLVIGFQNLVNTSVFLIPYEINPLVIIGVSILSIVQSFQEKYRSQLTIKIVFLIGILFYGVLSTRTLNLLYNQFNSSVFIDLLNNHFTALVSVVGFYAVMIFIHFKIKLKSILFYVSFTMLILSCVGALTNFEYLQVICFTVYVVLLSRLVLFDLPKIDCQHISPILYQLVLFIIIENTYFILLK